MHFNALNIKLCVYGCLSILNFQRKNITRKMNSIYWISNGRERYDRYLVFFRKSKVFWVVLTHHYIDLLYTHILWNIQLGIIRDCRPLETTKQDILIMMESVWRHCFYINWENKKLFARIHRKYIIQYAVVVHIYI